MKTIINLRDSSVVSNKKSEATHITSAVAIDNLNLYLAQARAMAAVAVEADFDNFTSATIQDYWGGLNTILQTAEKQLTEL